MHHTVRQRAGDKFSCLWNFCSCHSLRLIFSILTPVRRAVPTWVSYPALWRGDEVGVKDEQLWHCQDQSQVKFFVLLKVTFFDIGIGKVHGCNMLKRTKRLLFAPTNVIQIERPSPQRENTFKWKHELLGIVYVTEYGLMGGSKSGFRALLMESAINGPHFAPISRRFELTNVEVKKAASLQK